MPLDRQGINAWAWSGRAPHRAGPQLPAFCRSHRPTVMVTAFSLAATAVDQHQLRFPRMPALMPVRFHPSHHFQTDEQHNDVAPFSVAPFSYTCRFDQSPRSGLSFLEPHADLSAHHR